MITLFLAFFISTLIYVLVSSKRRHTLYCIYKSLPRDLTAAWRFFLINLDIILWEKNNETVPKLFEKYARKHPDKIAYYFEEDKWTYQQLDEYSNKIANYFKAKGLRKDDTVCLILENRPEYIGIWMGLSKLGVVTALINTNLTADPLIHCLNVSKAKAIVHGGSHEKILEQIIQRIDCKQLYQINEDPAKTTTSSLSRNLREELKDVPATRPEETDLGNPKDKIVYVFTSGTTGLPKAAVISNLRFMFVVAGMHHMGTFTEDDLVYNPLPLYHTAGGIMGAGQTLLYGTPMALRKKFSATNFWVDCKKYNCTAAQYIGEICRYLLTVHKEGTVIDHSVKKMFGNGLRPQIWNKFAETFHINHIIEFYGATEGNSNLINIDNKPGAVGFVPILHFNVYPVALLKIDEETGEPIRNKEGYCIRCDFNEPGLLVGKINPKRAVSNFTGYADKKATEKKIFKNVFTNGDMYFNTGDVLVQDDYGYFYFKDRTGDTFRWKGENVATSEVEGVISNVTDLKDATVYGVEIPGTEGRAGMMAIVDPQDNLDKEKLYQNLKANLPSYAVPIFLRVVKSVDMTGTFKIKKKDLKDSGYSIDKKDETVYYLDAKNSRYSEVTKEIYEGINNGKIRL
ncbi:long-chain fatty acid transport protein 4 [Aethina tumida]|uniref:long-chain fatty acid transport protein 4 n=1 Tax=Aethina tumida TaxID=116153 RepID=UPI00214810FD|nr:long-chain fatty acid transport protein 4 [Aethina tumida]